MAKAKRGPGKPFAPGASGNTGGRPKTDPEILDAKQMTRATVLQAMHDVMKMPAADLEKQFDPLFKPYSSGAQALMASVLSKAIALGCPNRAQFFMSYIFGRPTEYDPKLDDTTVSKAEKYSHIPSEVMIEAMRAVNRAKKEAEQSAS